MLQFTLHRVGTAASCCEDHPSNIYLKITEKKGFLKRSLKSCTDVQNDGRDVICSRPKEFTVKAPDTEDICAAE